jgi:hypothetical protein
VFCTRHLKENVNKHLDTKGVAHKVRKQIKKAVFGPSGVLSVENVAEYDVKWLEFEAQYGHKFGENYFQHLEKRLRQNVLLPHFMSDAIDIDWTNNNADAMHANLMLRRDDDGNIGPLKLPQIIDLFCNVYKMQRAFVQSAFQNYGKFQLRKSMRIKPYFQRPAEWQGRSEEAQDKMTSQFYKGPTIKPSTLQSKDGMITVPNKEHYSAKQGSRHRPKNDKTSSWTGKTPVAKNPPKGCKRKIKTKVASQADDLFFDNLPKKSGPSKNLEDKQPNKDEHLANTPKKGPKRKAKNASQADDSENDFLDSLPKKSGPSKKLEDQKPIKDEHVEKRKRPSNKKAMSSSDSPSEGSSEDSSFTKMMNNPLPAPPAKMPSTGQGPKRVMSMDSGKAK